MRTLGPAAACGLILFAGCMPACFSQGKHIVRLRPAPAPVAAQPAAGPDLSFLQVAGGAPVFSANSAGVLPMGNMAPVGGPAPGVQAAHTGRDLSVRTTVGIRLGNISGSSGPVILKAWLSAPADPYEVFVDHVRLSEVPAALPVVNSSDITQHVVEVRIPDSAHVDADEMKALILFEIVKN
ncbi:MAG: hypothetical protein ACLGSD_03960 [Acidobacteriota bacterium]